MSETNLMKRCLKAASSASCKLFRNNVGKLWAGKPDYIRKNGSYFCNAGDVIVRKARRFHAGLHIGSGDAIGWKEVVITPDMIGKKVAVFVSLEIKTAKGKPSAEQMAFIKAVKSAGGIAGIARSEDDARKITSS